ncbi:hypothetical protein ONS95_004189 [Cadophora gregata]|uniref:uncharacterized protein n=1 Tax=Cadophora gregata TaxID=51156 RepID=UPI0026DD49F1|nr:uncharacterized protein ONS95_004189 [Cadophora gregata]KAK0105662.1 hypothetical protein ONS95_004189 [Cadophora gregata]
MLLKLTTVVPLLLSITGVQAGYYSVGEQWGWTFGYETARQHVRNACHGYWEGSQFKNGAFQDTWFKSNSESSLPATVCINAVTNKVGGYHMVLQITNLQNNARTLSQTDCENGLMSEIDSCPAGGQSDKWGWRFRSDPNLGWC